MQLGQQGLCSAQIYEHCLGIRLLRSPIPGAHQSWCALESSHGVLHVAGELYAQPAHHLQERKHQHDFKPVTLHEIGCQANSRAGEMLTWPDDAAAFAAGKHIAQAAACGLLAEESHSGDSDVLVFCVFLGPCLSQQTMKFGMRLVHVSGPMSLQGPDT